MLIPSNENATLTISVCYSIIGLAGIIAGIATPIKAFIIIGFIFCLLGSIAFKYGETTGDHQNGGYLIDITSSVISNL